MKGSLYEEVIEALITEKDYVTVDYLAEKLKVSTKTIRNYIVSNKVKEYLGQCTIEKRQNKGVKIIGEVNQINDVKRKIENMKVRKEKKYSVLKEESTGIILKKLFSIEGSITIKELSNYLYKSINTTIKDVGDINKWLYARNIKILSKENYGMWIEGTEEDIRKVFKEVVYEFIDESKNLSTEKFNINKLQILFNNIDIENLKEILKIAEVVLNNKFTQNDFNDLLIKISILVTRVRANKTIKNLYINIRETKEYLAAQLIKINLEKKFQLNINYNEVDEITKYLLSARRQVSEVEDINNIKDEIFIARVFIKEISEKLEVDLSEDKGLINSLLLHLRPAIRRIQLGGKVLNPLLEQIRYQYTDIYIAVLTSIQVIEKVFMIGFDESEIGYICLHIASALFRKENGSYLNCILICDSGITMAKYLESIISNKIKDINIKQLIISDKYTKNLAEEVDLILNASNCLLEEDKKVIKISDMFNENDYLKVKNWILEYQVDKLKVLQLNVPLNKNNIFIFNDNVDDVEKILNKYGEIIENKGFAKEGFAKSLIDRERKASTAIGRGVAIPHGYNEFVIKCSLVIIKLKKEILWEDQNVNIVIIFTPNKKEKGSNKYFFRNLYNVIKDSEKLEKVKNTEDINEIEKMFIK